MDYNQNYRISQVTEKTLIIGVDIAKKEHYARAFDYRGIEFGKVFKFKATSSGFEHFVGRISELKRDHKKDKVIIGIEPTGHYWFTFTQAVTRKGMLLVQVNPYHVKCSKELDDNTQNKNDRKDPKTIAFLVKDGRYCIPYMPKGKYAELRKANNLREEQLKKLVAVKNKVTRWIDIYFPEFMQVFSSWDGKTALLTLEKLGLPGEISKMSSEEILSIWREEIKRGVGIRKAEELQRASKASVGVTEGTYMAVFEINMLIREYKHIEEAMKELEDIAERIVMEIPGAINLLEIKGIGLRMVTGFFAEVGDISRFHSAKQIIKLAGFNLRQNSSGEHKGETSITKRGRRLLRATIFRSILPLVAQNEVFKNLHQENMNEKSLKPKQSLIALCCRFIRIAYRLVTMDEKFDEKKLLNDIYRMKVSGDAA